MTAPESTKWQRGSGTRRTPRRIYNINTIGEYLRKARATLSQPNEGPPVSEGPEGPPAPPRTGIGGPPPGMDRCQGAGGIDGGGGGLPGKGGGIGQLDAGVRGTGSVFKK